ncbi:MAG: maleylpyruvate isomerase N-terminal domain-containing protein [Acidimicrobiales bacterium]
MASVLSDVRGVLGDELALIGDLVRGLSDPELIRASGCEGWRVADLIVHLRMSSEAILAGLVNRTDEPADRDFVTYWRDWPPKGPPGFADVRSTWATSAVYSEGRWLLAHFAGMRGAAERAARAAPPGRLSFQGHVLDVEDFLAMWTVEFTVHHLDLTLNTTEAPGPLPAAVELVTATLDGLLDAPRPAWWDTDTYIRKGSGRELLTEIDTARLGIAAERYPAFG